MRRYLKHTLLLVPPLLLAALEWEHPVGFASNVFAILSPKTDWWLILHTLQLPLFALIGTGLFVLLKGIHSFLATLGRIAAWFFIVYYSAFDSIAGIGLGVILRNVKGWSPTDLEPISKLVQLYFNDPYYGGVHSWMSQFASFSWLIAAWIAMCALYQVGRPRIPLFFLGLSGIFLWYSHAYPYGTIAFICLFLANLGLEFWPQRRSSKISQLDL